MLQRLVGPRREPVAVLEQRAQGVRVVVHDHAAGALLLVYARAVALVVVARAAQLAAVVAAPRVHNTADERGGVLPAARDGHDVVVMEAAVLLEAGWDAHVDEVWSLIARPEEQVERVCLRCRPLFCFAESTRRLATSAAKLTLTRVDALLAELYGVPDFAAFAKSEDVSKQQ